MFPEDTRTGPGESPASFAIVGGGKVGIALARQLLAAGHSCTGVACRSAASAKKAAERIGIARATDLPWEITADAKIVFITTPDGAIAGACRTINEKNGFSPETVVLHCSGALPSTVLTVPQNMNIARGSFHPLQSFATSDLAGNPFDGIIAAVEGDPAAVTTARAVGQALGATCFAIRTEGKTLYHAAAVVASNYLVTLLDTAFTMLEAAGIDRDDTLTILQPLIQGTLANIAQTGIPEALTGPVARGDVTTVTDHLAQIHDQTGRLLPLYQMLGQFTVPLALAKGTLSETAARKILGLFKDLPPAE